MKTPSIVVLVSLSALLPSLAVAESPNQPAERSALDIDSFGVRVGGYGFRRTEGDRRNAWDDCRMNGMGAFAVRNLGRNAFVEGGVDLYFSEAFPLEPAEGEDSMDRLSSLFTIAGGLRMAPAARISAYAQVGGGLELTKVEIEPLGGATIKDERALPVGFVGVGGDLRVSERLRLGMNLRAYVMGHFEHGHDGAHAIARDQDDAVPSNGADHGLAVEPEVAAQGQFYVQYAL